MTFSINSPIPSSLASECKKAAKILKGFADDVDGIDAIIPPSILSKAKGLAIFTVIKGGFIVSARAGSGLVVARLPDGTWSAPSAIITGGVGFGGQVGAELTDFVMVLNTSAAVKTFISHGSITLGGNVSVAIGPLGRNAEASGTASVKSIAAVYSYSKTKGLFAGLSFEGSVILENFTVNTKLYGRRVKTRDLLNGTIPPPAAAEALYRTLEIKAKSKSTAGSSFNSSIYHEDPRRRSFNTNPSSLHDDNASSFRRNSSQFNTNQYQHDENPNNVRRTSSQMTKSAISFSRGSIHTMAKTGLIEGGNGGLSTSSTSQWRQQQPEEPMPRQQISDTPYYSNNNYSNNNYSNISSNNNNNNELVFYQRNNNNNNNNNNSNNNENNRARALFNFRGQEEGDLAFQKGDVITIVKKTDSQNDWWTGSLNGRQGIFPANFVEVIY